MKSLIHSTFACLVALAAAAAAAQDVRLPCDARDAACMGRALHDHPSRKLAQWETHLARPVVDRIAPASASLVEYLTWDNIVNGYPERPRPATPAAGFLDEIRAAFADLPAPVQQLFIRRLAGIALVDHLGGTGYTDVVVDAQERPVAGYIVLDAAVLGRLDANAWATWKERTPFLPDDGWTLEARIEAPAQDNRRNAIQYILLHELGHVLSIGTRVHPPWTVEPKDGGPDAGYPFFSLSWRTKGNRYVSVFDDTFTLRGDFSYYMGARLPGAKMAEVYTQLARTNFPSLYAAVRPGDDFAESFASYVHVVMMGKPWEIVLRQGGRDALVFKACWEEARCAPKRKLLEAMLAPP